MPDPRDIRAVILALESVPDLAQRWQDLERRSRHSFFISWCWIGTWLEKLPPGTRPLVFVASQGELTVGLALLIPRRTRRYGVIASRRLYLHESGDPALDELTIEHNQLLADAALERAVAECFLDTLVRRRNPDWDELVLSGVPEDAALLNACREQGPTVVLRQSRALPALYVDLDALARDDSDYLSQLGSSTRSRIRRSLRAYTRTGPVQVNSASTTEQAFDFFDQLVRLHEANWKKRGQAGAFPDHDIIDFHRRLIKTCQPLGRVDLLKISTPGEVLGYFYNYVHDGHVYYYQSGFNYANAKLSPGLVCNYLAIEHYRKQGARVYDFLAGDIDYKRRLADRSQQLNWVVLQRNRLRFRLENTLRALKRAY